MNFYASACMRLDFKTILQEPGPYFWIFLEYVKNDSNKKSSQS